MVSSGHLVAKGGGAAIMAACVEYCFRQSQSVLSWLPPAAEKKRSRLQKLYRLKTICEPSKPRATARMRAFQRILRMAIPHLRKARPTWPVFN